MSVNKSISSIDMQFSNVNILRKFLFGQVYSNIYLPFKTRFSIRCHFANFIFLQEQTGYFYINMYYPAHYYLHHNNVPIIYKGCNPFVSSVYIKYQTKIHL